MGGSLFLPTVRASGDGVLALNLAPDLRPELFSLQWGQSSINQPVAWSIWRAALGPLGQVFSGATLPHFVLRNRRCVRLTGEVPSTLGRHIDPIVCSQSQCRHKRLLPQALP